MSGGRLGGVQDVVRHLLAVQGQEFGAACWAVAQRCDQSPTRADLRQLCDDGVLLRTHLLRPTWHLVLPEDIGWLLDLTGPRVLASMTSVYRKAGLDAATLDRATDLIASAISDRGGTLSKKDLDTALLTGGVELGGLRPTFFLLFAELTGVICSGPRMGKVHGYALFAERAPQTRRLSREDAVTELVRRYFTSHGPATIHDLRWWSSLTIADIRTGIEGAGDALVALDHDGRTFYAAAERFRAVPDADRAIRLLPVYDEYVVAYTGSRWLLPPAVPTRSDGFDPGLASNVVVRDAAVIGEWRTVERAGEVVVEITMADPPSGSLTGALHSAAADYGRFVEKDVVVRIGSQP